MTQDQFAEIGAEAPNLPAIRHDGWTPSRQRLFLETLAGMGVVRAACRVAGMSYEAAYQFRLRADGLAFKLGWEAAAQIARRRLADDLMERSLEKQEEEVTRDGNVIRRCRYDNRVALGMLTRLDKFCREDSADTRLACMIEDDFSSFLDLVQKQGSEAALGAFVHARLDGTTAELLINGRCQLREMVEGHPALLGEDREEKLAYTPHNLETYADAGDVWKGDDGEWVTNFPPPPGFDGEEEGRAADNDYTRSLTSAELAIVEAREAAKESEFQEVLEPARDAFFGFVPASQAALDAKAARERKAEKDRAQAREKAETKRIAEERAQEKVQAKLEAKSEPKPAHDPGPIADPEPSALAEPSAPPARVKAPLPVPTPETGPIRVVDPDTGIASIYMVPPQPPGLPPKWLRNRAGW
jgi:hypothetical protein